MQKKDKIVVRRRTHEDKLQKETQELLEKVWNGLPSDFSFGERSLFIEVAERLIKLAGFGKDKTN